MAGLSFLRNVAGRLTEILGLQTSAGAGDAGKIAALDSTGRFDITMMPVGITPEVASCTTSEDIAAGSWCNLYLSGGVLTARKADATAAGKECNGFVLASTTSGQTATVYLDGSNTQVTGLTIGTSYFLDTTAGGSTATAPSGSGNVVQCLGKATAATALMFVPTSITDTIVHA